MSAATALLDALQTLPRLSRLHLICNSIQPEHAAAAGAALAAVIAHSTSLSWFSVADCQLGDAGIGPITDALPLSRRLNTLVCTGNGMSEACARERLLPAVRACATLRILEADDSLPAVREAQELLQQRR